MKKKRIVIVNVLIVLLTFTSLFAAPVAHAGYKDNSSKLYYFLSQQVYNANGLPGDKNTGIQKVLDQKFKKGKYKVLDTIDVNNKSHKAATRKSGGIEPFKDTGFKAMAVVSESEKKLFIAIAGSQIGAASDFSDAHTARNVFEGDVPGQLYHAQLYLNYIYSAYPKYKDYKWYFTGHSLGGFVASKLYLDIQAKRWHYPSNFYVYGKAVKKTKISGVYTFNPLPVPKSQVSSTQWNANKKGTYNSEIKNFYIQNEWLNGIYDMYPNDLAYFGTQEAIDKKVKHYKSLNYKLNKVGSPPLRMASNTMSYYLWAKKNYKPVYDYHGLSSFEKHVK